MPDHTDQLNRIESLMQALSEKVDMLIYALAEDEEEPTLTLDGAPTGAERDASQPL